MKLKMTLDVDPKAWEREYGEASTPENVASYVRNLVQQSAAGDTGAITRVRVSVEWTEAR